MDNSPVKMLQQIRRRVQAVTYGNPLYRLMLDQGSVPDRLRLSIPDPWPGDAKLGQALIASQPALFDDAAPFGEMGRKSLLTFDFLRDLRAVGSDLARRKAVSMIHEWLEDQEEWDEDAWAPDVLGARLANWIAFFDFYGSAASHDFTKKMIVSMVRQLRHLIHVAPAHLTGIEGLCAIKGLVYGGLALIDGQRALGIALTLLTRQIDAEVLPDGGTVFRNPVLHAEMLRLLIDLRTALRVAQMEMPAELTLAIARMVPALKFFRHGDGGLALFNGAREGSALTLDATLTMAEVKGRVLKRLAHMGYERLTAGRSLLLVDSAGPPPRPYDQGAHAGLMSFEFSVGRERLITNCGALENHDPAWRRALAATAAHNTVTLGDTNACEVLVEGGIGHRPRTVDLQRYEQEGVQYVDMTHDGYAPRQRVMLQRVLALTEEGDELRGKDVLMGASGRDFTVRWHIHPDVNVMLAQGGGSALLRTPSGSGWRFRVHGRFGEGLGLEASVYCAHGAPRRTLQLFVTGRTTEEPLFVEWTLTREKTKKGSRA
ncbi:MAG: heparinase II/III family protein [Bdellovibrionales bacterium]|jgi:uncharacterized heparinase superfamily protein